MQYYKDCLSNGAFQETTTLSITLRLYHLLFVLIQCYKILSDCLRYRMLFVLYHILRSFHIAAYSLIPIVKAVESKL